MLTVIEYYYVLDIVSRTLNILICLIVSTLSCEIHNIFIFILQMWKFKQERLINLVKQKIMVFIFKMCTVLSIEKIYKNKMN